MSRAFIPKAARPAIVLFALVSAGCYSYIPATGDLSAGAQVRARLTAEAALQESELTGALTQSLQGRLLSITNDSLQISIVAARAVGVGQTQTARRTVGLPRASVTELFERRLSAVRTGATVLVAGGVAAAILGGVLTTGGDSGGGDGGGDPAFRALFRIPIGR